jgi:hypothetical protein
MGAVGRQGLPEEVEGAGTAFIPPPGPVAKGEGSCAVEAPIIGVNDCLEEGGRNIVGVCVDDCLRDDISQATPPHIFHGVVDDPPWGGIAGSRWDV